MPYKIFINFSNHPSKNWGEKQISESERYGSIVDVPFPNVSAEADEAEVRALAQQVADRIIKMSPAAVMCQGEFTLTFAVVRRLQEAGITALSACSRRRVTETRMADGTAKKEAIFEFVRYREYC